MKKAISKATGLVIGEIISTVGGWTSIQSTDGKLVKMRNNSFHVMSFDHTTPKSEDGDKSEDGSGQCTRGRIKNSVYDKSKYCRTKSSVGTSSLHCGDGVAVTLEGKSLEWVYHYTAEKLGMGVDILKSKYVHLNSGMQRMNLGNLIRNIDRKNKNNE